MSARIDGWTRKLADGEWQALALLAAAATVVGAVAGIAGVYPAAFVLVMAPLLLAALRSLPAACALIVLSSPLVSIGSIDVGFHLLPSYLFVAAGLAGAARRGELRQIERRPWDWLLLAFLLVATVVSLANIGAVPRTTVVGATGANGPRLRSLAQLTAIMAMGALYLVIRANLTSRERLHALIRALLVATAFVALYGLYQVIGRQIGAPYTFVNSRRTLGGLPPAGEYLRPSSTLTEASPLAQFMLTSLFLGVAWLRSPGSRPAWIPARAVAILAALTGAVVAATLSFAAWVSASLWGPLVIVMAGRTGRRRIAIGLAVAVVVVIVVVLPFARTGGGNLSGAIASQRYVRAGYWITGAHVAVDHPFGVGVGNFPFYYPLYAPLSDRYEYQVAVADAHNVFLDAAAETGVVGFLLWTGFFVALIVAGLRAAIRAGASRAAGGLPNMALALSASLAAGATMHLTYSYAYYPFEWVLAGMVGTLPTLLANARPDPP